MRYTKLLNNHVAVRVDSLWADTIKLEGGMVLYIDTTTQNPRYATTNGTVVQVPPHLVCIQPKNQNALEWETICEVHVGDQVWFQYDAMITATKDPRLHWVEDGQLYVLMNYRWLYVAKRVMMAIPFDSNIKYCKITDDAYVGFDSKKFLKQDELGFVKAPESTEIIIPLNGYCLCEPVYADEYPKLAQKYQTSELLVDKRVKIPNVVRVIHFSLPNVRYQDKVYSDDMVVLVGDIVLTAKHSDVPLEYELYRSFDKDREIYRIQRRYMMAVIGIEE